MSEMCYLRIVFFIPPLHTNICILQTWEICTLVLLIHQPHPFNCSGLYFMLYDADWIRFFLRTITPSVELVPPKSLALLNCLPVFQAFIMWILVRDPLRRPSLDQIRMKGLAVRDSLLRQNVGTRTELQLINYRSEISDLIHEKYFISHKHTKAAGA